MQGSHDSHVVHAWHNEGRGLLEVPVVDDSAIIVRLFWILLKKTNIQISITVSTYPEHYGKNGSVIILY